MKTAYICNGLDPECSDKPGCYRTLLPGMDHCRHTFSEKYAANGTCADPENHPERFSKIELTYDEDCWWEGGVEIPI